MHNYNIDQLRVETWKTLRKSASSLTRVGRDSAEGKKVLAGVEDLLEQLVNIERYFAFPGLASVKCLKEMLRLGKCVSVFHEVNSIFQLLKSDDYSNITALKDRTKEVAATSEKNYFEVLFVDNMSEIAGEKLRIRLQELYDENEAFVYQAVMQSSFQDALIALLFNYKIQAVVVGADLIFQSQNTASVVRSFIEDVLKIDLGDQAEASLGGLLGKAIRQFRPEVDIYYVTDAALMDLEDSAFNNFDRIFYQDKNLQELHFSILHGIRKRFETPFFSALVRYSQRPTDAFHAMPLSRGNSVSKSNWMKDFRDFYGRNTFLAETSATTGGLDSLLQPTGSLKKAQEMAAKAYGAKRTFFVTNGTSTANKIVQQAIVKPGDLVLIDRNCHKSHHYGLVLTGAFPVYLDAYPIEEFSMYGTVPLAVIKAKLLELKAVGQLDKVKMLLLTNCTFDGLVYNVEKVMEEVLAIKPDMIFLWDEAWFSYARFFHTFRQRTGMFVANKLFEKYQSEAYVKKYQQHIQSLSTGEMPSMPDPEKVKIRVYTTQSTHKTLSSFRQGSMIHIWDEDFQRKTTDAFHEAYMTHTTTSPNYQILASLDVSRRQVQFEGYELTAKSIEMGMLLRAKINSNPLLRKYFKVLDVEDIIPAQFRSSGLKEYYSLNEGWNRSKDTWGNDGFVLDPTKITLSVGGTGIDGDTFKTQYLMDRFNIQINKTSRNTVLFMIGIGATLKSVAHLVKALLLIAKELDESFQYRKQKEIEIAQESICSLTEKYPPLPNFSHFHSYFKDTPGIPGGNIRKAYFKAYREEECEYISLADCLEIILNGEQPVSASFVSPYPPGFPVLIPGQLISREIIQFLLVLDIEEIHGYQKDLGLKIFSADSLKSPKRTTTDNPEKRMSDYPINGETKISKVPEDVNVHYHEYSL